MYAVKVKFTDQADSIQPGERSASTLQSSREAGCETETIGVSVGNPRVEHVTGLIHLYRELGDRSRAAGGAPSSLPGGACTQLCVLSLPAGVGFANFCSFVGAFLARIRELRVVRRAGGRGSCMVLLHFWDAETTREFYANFNDTPFSSLEPEIVCRLLYVKDLELIPSTAGSGPALSAPPGQTELPACPVCLERLDEHISGIATTVCNRRFHSECLQRCHCGINTVQVCNHRFHSECLQRWGDMSCPVCRYCSPSSTADSRCSTCNTSQDLWMCLICGHVGCGRYRKGHAAEHSRSHNHAYSLELEAQRVWDYTNDNYVHRLVQSKKNGKLMELPSPAPSSSQAQRTGDLEVDSQTEEALVASKIDYLAEEYSQLLVSQLDEQRAYFSGLLGKHTEEAESRAQESSERCQSLETALQVTTADAKNAERKCRAIENKMAVLLAQMTEVTKDRDFLKDLNDQLELNQAELQRKCKGLEDVSRTTIAKKDEELKDLQEQVHDLMMNIEASRSIEREGGDELRDASLLPSPEACQRQAPMKIKKTNRRR